ncbi:MAG: ArdC family protein [Luteimonas sp.]
MEIKQLLGGNALAGWPQGSPPTSASAAFAESPPKSRVERLPSAERAAHSARQTVFDIGRHDLVSAIERGVMSAQDDFGRALPMPVAAATARPYHGQNIFLLAAVAQERGYDSNAWCSYKAAEARGWQVKKGEKGTRVFFFQQREFETGDTNEETGEPEMVSRPVLRYTNVFNLSQVDTSKGDPVPEAKGLMPCDKTPSKEAVQMLDRIGDEMGIEVCFKPEADATVYADSVLTVAAEQLDTDPRATSQLALGLLHVALEEGVRSRKPHFDPEIADARRHLRQVMAESLLSMRLGFPILGGTPLDAGKVVAATQSAKTAGSHAAGDAEAAVRYVLSFDPHMADDLKAEGQAMYDEILDAAGEHADQGFDASMIDFSYVEQRRAVGMRP